jgi:hypothetical protein
LASASHSPSMSSSLSSVMWASRRVARRERDCRASRGREREVSASAARNCRTRGDEGSRRGGGRGEGREGSGEKEGCGWIWRVYGSKTP